MTMARLSAGATARSWEPRCSHPPPGIVWVRLAGQPGVSSTCGFPASREEGSLQGL